MNIKQLIEALDGAGLVITDPAQIDEELANLSVDGEYELTVNQELLDAADFAIDEIEKWNDGKTHNIGEAFEALVIATSKIKAG